MMGLEHQRITKDKLQNAGINPKKIRKLFELFPPETKLTEGQFKEAGFDAEDIIKVIEIFLGSRTLVKAAYLTKEKLQAAKMDKKVIQKFAELFPDGTEVTRELCVKYPDIFSFGMGLRHIVNDRSLELALALYKVNQSPRSIHGGVM